MKPIKEWLETLPEPYRKEALAEYAARGTSNELQPNLHEALFRGFVWGDSAQGQNYWRNIVNRALDGEFDQLAKPDLAAENEALRKEVATLKAQLAAKEPPKVGDRVRVELPSMEGTVAYGDVTDGTYRVNLDGLGEEEDIWLKPERLARIE